MGRRLAALILALSAPLAVSARATEPAPACRSTSPTEFLIAGPISRETAACVAAQWHPGITDLVVDSAGGDLDAALDVAERIAPARPTITVAGACHSACAIYFLPVARRLVLRPGASIVLHGGADPAMVDAQLIRPRERRIRELMRLGFDRAGAEARYADNLAHLQRLVERQRAFAARHGIGLGWFLYREPGDEGVGRYLAGTRGSMPHPFGWRYMLAEETLLRSCLPRVEVEPFQSQLEASLIDDPARYRAFRRNQGLRSLTLRCVDPGG